MRSVQNNVEKTGGVAKKAPDKMMHPDKEEHSKLRKYFQNVKSLLRGLQTGSQILEGTEDQIIDILLPQIYSQLENKEYFLIADQSCSKIIEESLIVSIEVLIRNTNQVEPSDPDYYDESLVKIQRVCKLSAHILSFSGRLSKSVAHNQKRCWVLATNPYASFTVQTLLSLMPILLRKITLSRRNVKGFVKMHRGETQDTAEGKAMGNEMDAMRKSLKKLKHLKRKAIEITVTLCQIFSKSSNGGSLSDLISNPRSSHVMRSIVLCLAGAVDNGAQTTGIKKKHLLTLLDNNSSFYRHSINRNVTTFKTHKSFIYELVTILDSLVSLLHSDGTDKSNDGGKHINGQLVTQSEEKVIKKAKLKRKTKSNDSIRNCILCQYTSPFIQTCLMSLHLLSKRETKHIDAEEYLVKMISLILGLTAPVNSSMFDILSKSVIGRHLLETCIFTIPSLNLFNRVFNEILTHKWIHIATNNNLCHLQSLIFDSEYLAEPHIRTMIEEMSNGMDTLHHCGEFLVQLLHVGSQKRKVGSDIIKFFLQSVGVVSSQHYKTMWMSVIDNYNATQNGVSSSNPALSSNRVSINDKTRHRERGLGYRMMTCILKYPKHSVAPIIQGTSSFLKTLEEDKNRCLDMCRDKHGSLFVEQFISDTSPIPIKYRQKLVRMLSDDVRELCSHRISCHVVAAIYINAPVHLKKQIVCAIANAPNISSKLYTICDISTYLSDHKNWETLNSRKSSTRKLFSGILVES